MAAEAAVLVAAYAQGQGQVVEQAPLVLDEQGLDSGVEVTGVHAVVRHGLPVLAADGQVVVADAG